MAFGKCEGGGRRVGRRFDAPMPAILITMSERHPALLFNISRSGARVRAKDAPPKGTELFLQAGDLDIYARVVWQNGEQCGLQFECQIDSWDVERLHRSALNATRVRLTPAEKGGADDWAAGVAR